ncbi:MAG: hypothetical protein AB7G75_22550 [Candidatus Binatia bacterium]
MEVRPIGSATQGQLETPRPGSFQSGIGLVRGWACEATRVDIEVVGRASLPAVYGEPRGDTQAVCGDTNNGFSLQVNWNELGEGTHTVRALVDGVELGRAQVIVATVGHPYLQGVQGEFVVQPFPQPGQQTRLRWEESRQLFVLSTGGAPSTGGEVAHGPTRSSKIHSQDHFRVASAWSVVGCAMPAASISNWMDKAHSPPCTGSRAEIRKPSAVTITTALVYRSIGTMSAMEHIPSGHSLMGWKLEAPRSPW